jgi:hypothetical protein
MSASVYSDSASNPKRTLASFGSRAGERASVRSGSRFLPIGLQ